MTCPFGSLMIWHERIEGMLLHTMGLDVLGTQITNVVDFDPNDPNIDWEGGAEALYETAASC